MTKLLTHDCVRLVREAGYAVYTVEHLRACRWLLTVTSTSGGAKILILIKEGVLVTTSDVQDLASFVQVRNVQYGILLACNGSFSPTAHHTCTDLNDHLLLCTALPHADQFVQNYKV
jgi:hypothetical protein